MWQWVVKRFNSSINDINLIFNPLSSKRIYHASSPKFNISPYVYGHKMIDPSLCISTSRNVNYNWSNVGILFAQSSL